MTDIRYSFTNPAGSGAPTAPGEVVILLDVSHPSSPAYGIWRKAMDAFEGHANQLTIAEAISGLFVGVISRLRVWSGEGRAPFEVGDPRVGLYGRREAGGWVFLLAHLPRTDIVALSMTCDSSLSDASIQFEVVDVWRDAIQNVGEYDEQEGYVGFGSPPQGSPPFWASHVMSGEVGIGAGGFVDLPVFGPETNGTYVIEVEFDDTWGPEVYMTGLVSGPGAISGIDVELVSFFGWLEDGVDQFVGATFEAPGFDPLSDPLTAIAGRLSVGGMSVGSEAMFFVDGGVAYIEFYWALPEPIPGWETADQISFDIATALKVQP